LGEIPLLSVEFEDGIECTGPLVRKLGINFLDTRWTNNCSDGNEQGELSGRVTKTHSSDYAALSKNVSDFRLV
jgi:hypothetical protein